MKWKMFSRFVLIIVFSIIISLILNFIIAYKLFVQEENYDDKWDHVRDFSLTFNRYIEKKDDRVKVTSEGIENLKTTVHGYRF